MPKPHFLRVAMALGLGLAGVAALAARTIGQDGAAAKGAQPTRALPAAVIGSIDMDAVFKSYDKVEAIRKQIEAEAGQRKGELSKIMSEAQQVAKEMESLQPGSADFKNHDTKMTQLRAQLDAAREQAQREFAQREAEALATIFKEVQAMVTAVARHNSMTYVVRVSNEPINGADPNSAMAALARSVVYSDPSTDITQIVIRHLNARYQQGQQGAAPAGGGAAAAPATTPSPSGPAPATPSTNPAPARSR